MGANNALAIAVNGTAWDSVADFLKGPATVKADLAMWAGDALGWQPGMLDAGGMGEESPVATSS